jgi:hypothetical protein
MDQIAQPIVEIEKIQNNEISIRKVGIYHGIQI